VTSPSVQQQCEVRGAPYGAPLVVLRVLVERVDLLLQVLRRLLDCRQLL
jgi:hypothetical protein